MQGNGCDCRIVSITLFLLKNVRPALPEVWAEGSISGLKAIGDFSVAISWAKGKISVAEIVNNQGEPCVVKYAGLDKAQITVNGKAAKVKALGSDKFSIKSEAGDKISIKF